MGRALDELVKLLSLEPIEVNIFRGLSPPDDRQRVFGGQVAGQALMAAARTLPEDNAERHLHSLHAYFLRPGDVKVPILYEVDRIRDGRSFTTRRVVAIQHGRAIFNMSASFHVPEESFDHQQPMPTTPPPDALPTWLERWEPYKDVIAEYLDRPRPVDMRFVDAPPPPGREGPLDPRQRVWLKADGDLPDDPIIHACIVAWASDMTLLDTSVLPHGLSNQDDQLMMASLDHAMWFHRPFRIDEWMLFDQMSPTASEARGFAWGHVYTSGGDLAVSVVQEGLLRLSTKDRTESV
ncbi:MAG TPA: acyl-CoA thioesterase II [Acidimicrobiales bacterium]